MDRPAPQPAVNAAAPAPRFVVFWLIVLLGLCAWQGWMTWTLFGPVDPVQHLLDEEPVLSGSHPLHMYHGGLGAEAFLAHGTPCCYDPSFLAGYPKTPVFDSGSRPAELFFVAAGGGYRPVAYKIGLAAVCCLAPLFFLIAARGVGLELGGSCLAVALGLLIWWGRPARQALEAGDLDLLMGGLAAIGLVGLLMHFHRSPGLIGWLGLLLVGWLGGFCQPAILILLQPLVLVYYLSAGSRHRFGWHVALFVALAGGLAGNGFWLVDWAQSWWVRHPIHLSAELLRHRTFRTVWSAALWGGEADRNLGLGLFGLALAGVACLNQTGHRPAARVLGLGSAGLLTLAIAGLIWEPLGRVGTAQLVVPALWFAVPAAVYAVVCLAHRLGGGLGSPWRGGLLLTAGVAGVAGAFHHVALPFAEYYQQSTPLRVGLDATQQKAVEIVRTQTTPAARILWEDHRPTSNLDSRWTALLPILTHRAFLGGLDPEGCIEHSYASLVEGNLTGRPLAEWTDRELAEFCRRYNVGWVACGSKASIQRWRAYQPALAEYSLGTDSPGVLFAVGPKSFVLKGQARLLSADTRGIILADVVPDHGEVVLSFHYQAGMQASPGRVGIERAVDPYDPIPFIRLRVPAPVARVTLNYEGQ